MKHKNLILVTLLFINGVFSGFGQNITGRITGEIKDKQSQSALPGANIVIYVDNLSYGTTTDSEGYFSLDSIPVGRVSINISFIGYNSETLQNIELTSIKTLFLEIELVEKIENIEEVSISAYQKDKTINEFATVSSRTFTVEESNKFAGSWGDPARMVSNYAGVITAGDQRNDIIIRGNSPLGLVWRLDGIIIPNPNHFGTYGTTGGPISILNNN